MIRSEYYRRYVATLPCVHCGLEGHSQAAHANGYWAGKGARMKAHDCFIFPLCADRPGVQGCHSKWDQGKLQAGGDKAEIEATWCALTLGALLKGLQSRGVRL